ncbi:MAG: nitrate reductase cytochrome c-type subunit [Planctomycetota bacterium]
MPDDKTPPTREGEPLEPHGVPAGRAMHIVYVCAIAATVVGLYFGIRYEPDTPAPEQSDTAVSPHTTYADSAGVHPATRYADISRGNLGPNADWHTQLTAGLTQEEQWALISPASLEDKQRDLAARAQRRAFNGAPPTIPHRIDPVDATSCVACHGPTGMRVGDIVARPMPHEHYASCTQCHVPQHPVTPEETPWLQNDFEGLPAPTHGERAWDGAPPTIPHTTWMRSNCISCHGPNGADGLQSTHPWRTSCTQCHAPSAELDQQPGAIDYEQFFLQNELPTQDE